MTDWKQLADLFPFAALAGLGVPDIVVPGAGIFEPEWSSFFFGDPAVEDASRYRTIDINLVHPIKLTRLALSQFLAARKEKAAVIHISSIAGQIGRLGTPIYSATKFGINGFVRSLARIDPIFGIRVSAVAPGVIRTPLWEDHPEKLKMFEEGKDEWVEPEEVAEAMMRLVQDPKLPGGTILEVGAKNTRVVQYYGDPGPLGGGLKGHSLGRVHLLDDEMIEVLKKERDSGGEGGEV